MNALNLLEQHPKATAIIKSYYLEKLLSSVNSDIITEEFKEFVVAKGVSIENLLSIIDDVPRNLFDIFDSYKLFIQINVNTPYFSYSINEGDVVSGDWEKRKDAERAAIVEAFKLLEEMS
jgi:hypothetical protein